MNIKNLSQELKSEYEQLCLLVKELREGYQNIEIPIHFLMKLGNIEFDVKCETKTNISIYWFWPGGEMGTCKILASDINGGELSSKFNDVLNNAFNTKIIQVCDRVQKWEKESGLYFDGWR